MSFYVWWIDMVLIKFSPMKICRENAPPPQKVPQPLRVGGGGGGAIFGAILRIPINKSPEVVKRCNTWKCNFIITINSGKNFHD